MSETLLGDFEAFFAELPSNVRDDVSFMLVLLSDEDFVVQEVRDVYERAAQGLFAAKTRIGRIGNLISAVSVLDVYFAMDVHDRFDAAKSAPRRGVSANKQAKAALNFYAGEIGAIEAAKQRWLELRAKKFTPAAIAGALIPPGSPQKHTEQLPSSPRAHQSGQ